MMASIAGAACGQRVILLEKNEDLGKKLALTGGGRCNLTNSAPVDQIIEGIPGNGRFLHSALSRWDNEDLRAFFEGLGVKLKEEDHGRIFPRSDDARTVIAALKKRIGELGIDLSYCSRVDRLLARDGMIGGIKLSSGATIESSRVIVATGGKSFSSTGSSGDGYGFARALGHTVTPLSPGEVPLTSSDPCIRTGQLQGLSLQDSAVCVLSQNGRRIVTQRNDVLFTHFGLSGPAVLAASSFALKELAKTGEARLSLDILPDTAFSEVIRRIEDSAQENGDKSLKNGLRGILWERGFLPERLVRYFLLQLGLDPERKLKTLTKGENQSLAGILKGFTVNIDGSLPLEKAFVTCGGVDLREIDPKTMESKLIGGLYFCGEVLDIQGYTGGYNLTAAFVTGHLAGQSAARVPDTL